MSQKDFPSEIQKTAFLLQIDTNKARMDALDKWDENIRRYFLEINQGSILK